MPSVFLSHSSRDKAFVRELADFLQRNGDIRVWLDEREIGPGSNIVSKIGEGLDSDFVLLILSPDSVDSAWVREEWTDAFWEQTNHRRTKVAGVLYRDCQIPPLLRNKKYFDLQTNHPEGFRQIRTWLLTERPAMPAIANLLPTRPPLFIGREAELLQLRRFLQPGEIAAISGMPGRGKTTLALEFAYLYQHDFEKVYWLSCAQASLLAVATDFQRQLGLKIDGDLRQVLSELKVICAQTRTLLVLDNVEGNDFANFAFGGAVSTLVTTRQPGLPFLRAHHRLALDLFNEEQCLELFRSVLGTQVATHELECKELFRRIGYLPLAVHLLASLIQDDVRYTIARVCANLPADTTAVIKEAISALEPEVQRFLSAIAACAPQGFSLSLASSLVNLDEEAALEPLHQLASRSLVEELDRHSRRYRLHSLVREAAYDATFAQLHAEAVNRRFENWERDWKQCERDMPDFRLALNWAVVQPDLGPSVAELAYRGYSLNYRIGHPADALEISQRMAKAAEQRGDEESLQAWLGNHALILRAWGRMEEALALHKKEENLCLELSNKDGLQRSYGNQALILGACGRLEEALALQKKKEALCVELGNKKSLQISYGNQALILKAWGRLEEALALHKKEEALCLELGNKDGLQASYGNQALILTAWGRLDEALALHKKEEALCLELGNKDGLQASYGNQALILKAWGRLEEALALQKKKEAICLELGNKNSLQISYGNQALILQDWGRLEEALVLQTKKEALCLELGNRSSLAYSYWNQGLLARARNDSQTELSMLTAAFEIFSELNMPREREEVAAALAKANSHSA